MDPSLLPFFQPNGVVIVGASTSPEKLGYGAARNLIQSGYGGGIHFVAQKSGELFGRKIHTSLENVPDPVDLAILIVPTQATPQTIEDCAKRGIKAAVIVSAGFREVGAEGAALERQCVELARVHGIRLLGPNCIGTIDTYLPLDTTFLQPPMPVQGGIGFVSHSGAFAASTIDWARGQDYGFSKIVSLGNQADVNETDILPVFADDTHTKVITMYLEGISDGRRFVEVAAETVRHKPVIVLKAGRFAAGQKAATSHTGTLASSDQAFDAAFAKAGVLRADSAEQLFDWARALEACPRGLDTSSTLSTDSSTGKKRIAILTNAGGPGVIASDAIEMNGMVLSAFAESTLEALRTSLPVSASVNNPVDMLASASPETYAMCLHILLQDDMVDGVLVILPPPPMFKTEEVAVNLVEVSRQFHKPIIVALMGSTLVGDAGKVFQRASIPTYPFPERAASALGALARRSNFLTTKPQSRVDDNTTRPLFSTAGLSADELIAAYGIQTAPLKLARNEQEAVITANHLGFPVVMKIASPGILHKSDIGGVLLNITSVAEVASGYALLLERAKEFMSQAEIEGVHLQRQIADGQDVIIGAVRDPQFGPLMMFGSGGVEVEGFKDVAFALAPLNQAEAQEMIRKTWAGKKLKGFRSIPPGDEEAVVDVLVKLSRLALTQEQITEIEINPLRVLSNSTVALDVRMKTVV